MAIKTILVSIADDEEAGPLLDMANVLAERTGAHLIGLHVMEALIIHPGVAMHVPDPVYAEFTRAQVDRSDRIQAIFEEKTKGEDYVAEWRAERAEAITSSERIVESARAADLVILGQGAHQSGRGDVAFQLAQVIRASGRPVLVVPHGYSGPAPGKSLVVGWSATREAARAAHDAIALAEPGASVCIMSVDREGSPDTPTAATAKDLAAAYDRHGLKSEVMFRASEGHTIGEVLIQQAFECGADLIVTGAYGHSKIYDFVIGAVTQDLLANTKIPLLLSK